MTGSLLHALIAHSDSVFQGPNGDYPAVLEAVAGVSALQALWKPAPTQNSIWQIVEHLIAGKEWQIEMLQRGQAAPRPWVEPSGDEAVWEASLSRLKEVHHRLKLTLEQVPEDRLLEVPTPEYDRTLLELILSARPTHEAHHAGQIDYLRGVQAGYHAAEIRAT